MSEDTIEKKEVDNDGRPLRFGQRQLLKRQAGGQKEAIDRPVRTALASEDGKPISKSRRVKFSERNVISFDDRDPNFVYRVVNDDTKGNLEKARDIGYDFVESDKQIGDFKVAVASKFGKVVSKQVGNNTTAYLMRIPKEYYEEDRKAKDAVIDAREKALKPSKAKEEYGPGLTNE